MPDNVLYHYQSLISGCMVLLGFLIAFLAIRQRKKEIKVRETNFVFSIIAKLKIFEFEVKDSYEAFSAISEKLLKENYFPELDDFSNIRLPAIVETIWNVEVSLPSNIIIKIEQLIDSANSAIEMINNFSEYLKRTKKNCKELIQLSYAVKSFLGK